MNLKQSLKYLRSKGYKISEASYNNQRCWLMRMGLEELRANNQLLPTSLDVVELANELQHEEAKEMRA